MVESAQQLSEAHQALISKFADSPYVSLSFADGEPPRQYEVDYKLKGGLRQEDGAVSLAESHRVSILLPLDYPNSPPICKPLTPVFHPDFTTEAIGISNFWKGSNNSLAELITHIGRMIAGQIFGSGDPLNPEAAKWYQENGQRLPFDSADLEKDKGDLDLEIIGELSPSLELELELTLAEDELPSLEEVNKVIGAESSHTAAKPAPAGKEEGENGLDLVLEEPEDNSEEAEDNSEQTAEKENISLEAPIAEASPDVLPETPGDEDTEKKEEASVEDLHASYDLEKSRKKQRLTRLAALMGLGLFILGGGYFLLMDLLHYQKAESAWLEAGPLLSQKKYEEVKARGESALAEMTQILLLKKSEAESLKKEITTLFNTKEFQGGLAGKTLYDGVYVQKESISGREALKTVLQQGKAALAAAEWDAALVFFQEAEKLAASIKLDDPQTTTVLEHSMTVIRLNQLLEKGSASLEAGNLDEAVTTFQEAAALANSGAEIEAEKIAFIHQSLDRALVQKFVKEGEGAFAAGSLDKALESFEAALLLAEKEGAAAPESANAIRKSILQVKLYRLLDEGKTQYETSNWEAALLSFQEALRFILENKDHHPELAGNENAIRKKMLQVSLQIRDNRAVNYKMQKKLGEIVQERQLIIEQIKKSQFKNEPEFVELVKKSEAEIASVRHEMDIARKIVYLTENYLEIFQANHSLAHSATLRYPQVDFVREDGDIQVYTLRCTGYTTRGKVSLELKYGYDGVTQKWSLFKGD